MVWPMVLGTRGGRVGIVPRGLGAGQRRGNAQGWAGASNAAAHWARRIGMPPWGAGAHRVGRLLVRRAPSRWRVDRVVGPVAVASPLLSRARPCGVIMITGGDNMYRFTRKPRPKTDPGPILSAVLILGATLCLACTGAGDDPPQPEDADGDPADTEWETRRGSAARRERRGLFRESGGSTSDPRVTSSCRSRRTTGCASTIRMEGW